MNKDQVQGNLKFTKGKIKERWNELTYDEVDAAQGRVDQLVGHIQARYGKTKEKAQEDTTASLKKLKGIVKNKGLDRQIVF